MNLNDYPTQETDAVAEECSEMLAKCGDDRELNGRAILATASKFADKSADLERRLALCRDALKEARDALDASRMMVENEIACCEIAQVSANAWPDLLDGRVSGGGIKSALLTVSEALTTTAHTHTVLLSEDHNRSFAVPATIDASTGLAGRLPQGDR